MFGSCTWQLPMCVFCGGDGGEEEDVSGGGGIVVVGADDRGDSGDGGLFKSTEVDGGGGLV